MSEIENRIDDKIGEIERCFREMESIVPESFEEYSSDLKSKAACERYFERIMESVISILFLVIRGKNYESPRTEDSAFNLLADKGIISQELAVRMKEAKGMRNFIVHQYGEIDDSRVFHSVSEELNKDVMEFIESVKRVRW